MHFTTIVHSDLETISHNCKIGILILESLFNGWFRFTFFQYEHVASVKRSIVVWVEIGDGRWGLQTCTVADLNAGEYNWDLLSMALVFPHILVENISSGVSLRDIVYCGEYVSLCVPPDISVHVGSFEPFGSRTFKL